MKKATRMNP
ncbi:hypothetical protein E2I00_006195 [Balaenoptera physalus]|uniref:Uncharacterized protein n=1 Tax=Balaenoptera physalus TaxID=9770 RepID=A0A6A1Q191_BALPH|nr:hypothetical protein E2I00_006195 [Balaenoptera physalus]